MKTSKERYCLLRSKTTSPQVFISNPSKITLWGNRRSIRSIRGENHSPVKGAIMAKPLLLKILIFLLSAHLTQVISNINKSENNSTHPANNVLQGKDARNGHVHLWSPRGPARLSPVPLPYWFVPLIQRRFLSSLSFYASSSHITALVGND